MKITVIAWKHVKNDKSVKINMDNYESISYRIDIDKLIDIVEKIN